MVSERKQREQKLLNFERLSNTEKTIVAQIKTLDSIITSLKESGTEPGVFSLIESLETVLKVAKDMERHCKKFSVYWKIANKFFLSVAMKEKTLAKK